MNSSVLWYATRATGFMALILLTGSVVLGMLTSVRYAGPALPRVLTAGLHRNVSLLVVAFLAVHVLTSVVDSYAPVGWLATVLPFASSYRRVWVGLGTLAFDLLAAVVVTSLLRLRLGRRTWRSVHWLAYACWPIALAHSFGAGTDTRLGWVLFVDALCVAAVLLTLWWRLATGWPSHAGLRVGSAALSVLTPAVLGVWLATGPLAPHWAARAGTPAALLANKVTAANAQPPSSPSATPRSPTGTAAPAVATFRVPFTARLTGSLQQSAANSAGTVRLDIVTRLSGSQPARLEIVIDGVPDQEGGVSLTSSEVSFGPDSAPAEYRGTITALAGDNLQAHVTAAQQALDLNVSLRLDDGHVGGQIQVDQAGQGAP